MRWLETIYWLLSRFIYCWCLDVGRNAKLKIGGTVKNGGKGCISIGDNFFIGKDFLLATYPIDKQYGKLRIGNNVVAQERVRISAAQLVEIGNDVLMASDILITDNNHGMNAGSTTSYMRQKITARPVVIGDGCWIGEKCTILPGSIIGERSIIGANSVVTGDIPAYVIAVGAPAKIIKRWNFDSNQWERVTDTH